MESARRRRLQGPVQARRLPRRYHKRLAADTKLRRHGSQSSDVMRQEKINSLRCHLCSQKASQHSGMHMLPVFVGEVPEDLERSSHPKYAGKKIDHKGGMSWRRAGFSSSTKKSHSSHGIP